MDGVEIVGYRREDFSRKVLRKQRNEGNVPGVMYGNKTEEKHFFVPMSLLKGIVYNPEPRLITFNLSGEEHMCIVKEVQKDPVNDILIHVDFYEVDSKSEIEMNVSINPTGTAIGVSRGGLLFQKKNILRVKGKAADIPNKIDVDITNLDEGQTIRVEDIGNTKGFTIINNPRTPLFYIKPVKK